MNHNEPAYPVDELQQHAPSDIAVQHFGMSIRWRTAIAAMQGLLANSNMDYAPLTESNRKIVIKEAWLIADEMIEYGNKSEVK